MKKKGFLLIFLGAHFVFVILQIHKHSQIVKLSYFKQKIEIERDTLFKKRDNLMQNLHTLKTPDAIKKYAQHNLNMKQVGLQQIKKLHKTETQYTHANA